MGQRPSDSERPDRPTLIHPTALCDASARMGSGVRVGAFAVIEDGVIVGDDSIVEAHAIVRSGTRLGSRNVVHPFAVIGGPPQDRRHAGELTRVEIDDDNVFREHVTVHAGTVQGGSVTRIGSHCLFMAGSHVAHDAVVGNSVTLANQTLLAGHVVVGDHVVTGGHVAVAPFVRIGERAFLAGGAMVERDVPPFVIVQGDRARVRALNRVGLVRSGVPEASQKALERAFRAIFRLSTSRQNAAAALQDDPDPFVRRLCEFVLERPLRPR